MSPPLLYGVSPVEFLKRINMHTNYLKAVPAEWQSVSAVFEALGDVERQRLMLAFEPGERLTAGQLASVSPLSRPTVSHHLKVLRQAGVLCQEKVGKEVHYWVASDVVSDALTRVLAYMQPQSQP